MMRVNGSVLINKYFPNIFPPICIILSGRLGECLRL